MVPRVRGSQRGTTTDTNVVGGHGGDRRLVDRQLLVPKALVTFGGPSCPWWSPSVPVSETFTPAAPFVGSMVDVETAQEGAMWVVVLAAATLAAARFATYVNTVRLLDVRAETAVAWWATYAIAVGLIVVGLLGQRRSGPRRSQTPAWLALLVGVLVLVLMPATPAASTALSTVGLARPG